MKHAIILCSGGLDSVVTAHYVRKRLEYDHILVLFFNYWQRTLKKERKAAYNCARELKASFREIRLSELGKISTSIINSNKKAKKVAREDLKDTKEESNKYYVPARNTVFLVYALALAESKFVKKKQEIDIFVGFKNEGQEAYPDTTMSFVEEFNKLGKRAVNANTKVIAPLIKKDKEDIIKIGIELGVDFTKTHSCYISKRKHCGYCLSCRLRQEAFYWAGVKDPTLYKVKMKDFR